MALIPRVIGLLLFLQLCQGRSLSQTVLDCAKVHPSCTSCVVSKSSPNGLVQTSELVCRACRAPEYQVVGNGTTSTCGEWWKTQQEARPPGPATAA